MTAPLQLIALTFRLDADAESRLLAEVDRIEGRGVLRVLDMVLVAKGQDGTVEELEVGDDEDFGSLLASISPFGAPASRRARAWLPCRTWRTPSSQEARLPFCWLSTCGLARWSTLSLPWAVR